MFIQDPARNIQKPYFTTKYVHIHIALALERYIKVEFSQQYTFSQV